jgi:hypothetical protein
MRILGSWWLGTQLDSRSTSGWGELRSPFHGFVVWHLTQALRCIVSPLRGWDGARELGGTEMRSKE